MNTTRQSKTWPYDLVKGIILLILLGLMLYSRPDMSAQIQRQLGLPFGTVTVLDAPQVIGNSATTLSGHTQSGALVEVFAGEASLGTATAGPDGSWSLPVTLPTGTYQLRAQARDSAGAALGAAAVLEWSSQQQVAGAAAAAPTPAAAAQAAAAGTQAAGDTNTKADTEAGTAAAGTTADSGTAAGSPDGETEAETAAPSTATDANTGANTGSQSAGAASSAAAQGSLSAAQVADGAANLSGVGTPGTTVEIVAVPAAVAGSTAGAVTSGAGNKTAEIEGTGTSAANGSEKDAFGKEVAAKVVLGSVVVAADGTWQLSAKINPGEYSLAVRTLDSDGAIVDESATVPLSVPVTSAGEAPAAEDAATGDAGQSTAPDAASSAAVTGTVPVTGSASTSAAPAATSITTPAVTSAAAPQVSAPVVAGDKVTLTGTAAPGGAVELVTNDEVLAEAVADADGLWIVTVQLDPGPYALRIRTVSSADNSIQYSRVVSLTVPAASGTTVAAGEAITQATASVVASTTAPTATAAAASAVAAAVPATGTTTLATPATKATAAGTATTPVAAASSTKTVTTAVTTTTPITTTPITATPMTAKTASTVGAAAAKTPAATPASTVPPGTATPTAHAAASAALTTTTAAAAAGAIAAPATAPGTPPTIREPEISGNTLTLSGTGTPGTSVEIVSGTTVLGKATVGADGTWSLASEVKPGSYKFQVVRRDASGAVISQSPVVSLDIPVASAAPELDKPEIAADKTITLTGSGTPGSAIEIVQDGAVIATTDVQDDGQWSYSYPAAKTGNVQVAAQVSGQPATRTRPVIVVVPVVVAPPAPAPTAEAATTAEPTAEAAAASEPASAGGESGGSGGQAHVVEPGDTLTSLALEYLGSERRYPEIVAATNIMAKQDPAYKQITDPNLIVVGQQLWIPAP